MATIYNSDTIKRILDDAGIQTSIDDVPIELARKVVPVIISNPERVSDIVESKASAGTIYTTPTDKDFYLVSCWVSGAEDSGSGAVVNTLTVVIDGATKTIAQIDLTSQNTTNETTVSATVNNINLKIPIKLDRGSVITLAINSSDGAAGIIGYTVETSEK